MLPLLPSISAVYLLIWWLLSSVCSIYCKPKSDKYNKIELSVAANFHKGRVYFFSSDTNKNLEECVISVNNVATVDIDIVFSWTKFKGHFSVNKPGIYTMCCNRNRYTGMIKITDKLFQLYKAQKFDRVKSTTMSKINHQTSHKTFQDFQYNGTFPRDWSHVNIYLRETYDIKRFSAFYENGPNKTNISVHYAHLYIKELLSDTIFTLDRIHIEPVFKQVTPNYDAYGRPLSITKYHSVVNDVSPLFDGAMGWMKSYNFSAKDRLCGQGASIHFYDDGYHLSHEDLHNSKIKVRSQIKGCENFNRICDHGTASLGILAAMKNEYGIEGLSRCADKINLYSYTYPMRDVLRYSKPGDIFGANIQFCIPNTNCNKMIPLSCVYPSLANQFYEHGVILVQAAGNTHLNLADLPICNDKSGPRYGFVVSATVRNTDRKRDLGISDIGIGSFTNYNHPNSIVNNWGERVVTTFADSGSLYFGGRNKGYGLFGGTSSATPLTTALLGVLQGYIRSRCPQNFLNFDNFKEIFEHTGFKDQLTSGIGYMPNIYAAITYIENTFVVNCLQRRNISEFELEPFIDSYDKLFDMWLEISLPPETIKCSDNNVDLRYEVKFLTQENIMRWTHNGLRKHIVICQHDGYWVHDTIYIPVISLENLEILRGTKLTFIRQSMYGFRVSRTFDAVDWELQYGEVLSFELVDPVPDNGLGSIIDDAINNVYR